MLARTPISLGIGVEEIEVDPPRCRCAGMEQAEIPVSLHCASPNPTIDSGASSSMSS
jgi:hypothetical protein